MKGCKIRFMFSTDSWPLKKEDGLELVTQTVTSDIRYLGNLKSPMTYLPKDEHLKDNPFACLLCCFEYLTQLFHHS